MSIFNSFNCLQPTPKNPSLSFHQSLNVDGKEESTMKEVNSGKAIENPCKLSANGEQQQNKLNHPDEETPKRIFQPHLNHNYVVNKSRKSIIFRLENEEMLPFIGSCSLILWKGFSLQTLGRSIFKYGHSYNIISTKIYSVAFIQLQSSSTTPFLTEEIVTDNIRPPKGLNLDILTSEVGPGRQYSVVELLESDECLLNQLALLDKIFGGHIFSAFQIDGINESWKHYFWSGNDVLKGCTLIKKWPASNLNRFRITQSWRQLLMNVKGQIQTATQNLALSNKHDCVIMVYGPRHCGKSSLARVLINSLLDCKVKTSTSTQGSTTLSTIVYVECDPGQSQLTPPGFLSVSVIEANCHGLMTGLPFIEQHRFVKDSFKVFFGSLTPNTDPWNYLNSIQTLKCNLDRIVQELTSRTGNEIIPVIVNTCGWVKGLGKDLNQKVSAILEVDIVIVIESCGDHQLVPDDINIETNSQTLRLCALPWYTDVTNDNRRDELIKVQKQIHNSEKFVAADHRSLTTLSYLAGKNLQYLSGLLQVNLGNSVHTNFDFPLPVYCAPLKKLTISCLPDVPLTELLTTLPAMLVGLASSHRVSSNLDIIQQSRGSVYQNNSDNTDNHNLSYLGLGIVHYISEVDNKIYIITPCDSDELKLVDTIIKPFAQLEIPQMIMKPSHKWQDLDSKQSKISHDGKTNTTENKKVKWSKNDISKYKRIYEEFNTGNKLYRPYLSLNSLHGNVNIEKKSSIRKGIDRIHHGNHQNNEESI